MFLMGLVAFFTSCNGCSKKEANVTPANDSVTTIVALDVNRSIATDREAMYLKFGDDYRWFETCIRLPEFLDSEDVTSAPEMLVNIFISFTHSGICLLYDYTYSLLLKCIL